MLVIGICVGLLKIVCGFFSFQRGCSCRHGGQRGTAGSGGQPGQRVDRQTRLQEHTRYSLTDVLQALCLSIQLCHRVAESCFCLSVSICSDIREGVCAGKRRVLGQEENQSSKEESGPNLPAGSVV